MQNIRTMLSRRIVAAEGGAEADEKSRANRDTLDQGGDGIID